MSNDFGHRVSAVLDDDFLRTTLTRSTGILKQQRASAFADTASFGQLQAEARSVRMGALGQLPELLEQLDSQACANGMEVFWAEDAAAANRYLLALAEARRVRQVVRSHSAAVEEIGLDAALAAAGTGVVLTQVGDYIVQLAGDAPSHMVYPALHRRKEDVAALFEEKLDVPRTLDIQALASMVRFKLRRPILESTLSVSGVAFGVAETGTLVLTSDSGDDRFALATSPVHVAIMGIDQVVASLDDLALLLPLLSRSASGQPLASYTTWLNGPVPAGAADGPREVHLILLDNGRSDLLRWGYGEALACIRCGACQNACPVYREIGGQAYSSRGAGPIDSVFLPLLPAQPHSQPAAGPRGLRRSREPVDSPPAACQPCHWRSRRRCAALPSPICRTPARCAAPAPTFARWASTSRGCWSACAATWWRPARAGSTSGCCAAPIAGAWPTLAAIAGCTGGCGASNSLRRWPQPAAQTFRERWQARLGP